MKNKLIKEVTMPALENDEQWLEYAEYYSKRVLPSYLNWYNRRSLTNEEIKRIVMRVLADGFEAGSRERRRGPA